MIAKTRIVLFMTFGFVLGIVVGITSACLVTSSGIATAPPGANRGTHKAGRMAPPPLSHTKAHVDLGNGMKLTEETDRSETGEVWARASKITHNGRMVMLQFWDRKGAENEAGRNYAMF